MRACLMCRKAVLRNTFGHEAEISVAVGARVMTISTR